LSGDRQLGKEALCPANPPVAAQPHSGLFWLNNDRDDPGVSGGLDKDVQVPPPGTNTDYAMVQIRTLRNLEDFARLWIAGMPTLPTNQNYSVHIGWSQIESGTPKLRLYRASETNGGIGYLTNITTASQQIIDYSDPVGEVTPTDPLALPTSWFSNGLTRHFLFEAGGVGKGALTLTVSHGSNIVAQASTWMDFRDIQDLYEEVAITNVVQSFPEMVQTNLTSGFKIQSRATAKIGDAKQMVVFVHGWRMPYSDYLIFSHTMFKRLYWQGYQGRFAALRWPTRSSDTDTNGLDLLTYNRSEHISFQSGTGAALYFYDLRERLPDYTISVCSHSQGGIVMMEALTELAAASEAPLDHFVLMQVAVPAHCYDPAVTNLPALITMEQTIPTPNTYSNYAAAITNALRGGKVISFFNPLDFALASGLGGNGFGSWEHNQELMKPVFFLGYLYLATNGVAFVTTNQYTALLGIKNLQTRVITDPLELMPFVARARSKAVGAQAGVGAVINGAQFNLQSQLGFTRESYDHSGQFNRNIQTTQVQGF
jgi:pimeloyl-ACP methyl ester carboxylesterase